MKKEYELSRMNKRKNPFAQQLKQQTIIQVETDTLEYFQNMEKETGIPYQNLINLYLRECVTSQRKLSFQ
ncbi:antitoxin [Desulfobulbus sp. F5]|nr:antitoxin [Desulfobulbus sp. F5]